MPGSHPLILSPEFTARASRARCITPSGAHDRDAAGIEHKHAEAIAKAIDHGDQRVATRADLRVDVARLETRLV